MKRARAEESITDNFKKVLLKLAKYTEGVDSADVHRDPAGFKDQILDQWRFSHSSLDSEPAHCFCGVQIHERCYLRNMVTGMQVYVGNVCITHFNSLYKSVIKASESLKANLIVCVESVCCYGAHYHIRFFQKNNNFVKLQPDLLIYFGGAPIDQRGNFIVQNPGEIEMRHGEKYKVQMTIHTNESDSGYYLLLASADANCEVSELELFLQGEQNAKPKYTIGIKMMKDGRLADIDTLDLTHVYLVGNDTRRIKDALKARGKRPGLFRETKWCNPGYYWRIDFKKDIDSLLELRRWIQSKLL